MLPAYLTYCDDPNVGFGSAAALRHRISLMAANGRIPVVPQRFFKIQNLNVCFSRKRTFKLLEIT